MKVYIQNLFFLPALIAGLGLILDGQVTAQTFTCLYCFTNGVDGANPNGGLILSGNTLYGTTAFAGGNTADNGTVFSVNTNGMGITTPHSFSIETQSSISPFNYTNKDGANPQAGLILSGNTLYGTASGGGNWGVGTVFAVNINSTDFTNLHNFTIGGVGSDGNSPNAGLVLSGNMLYGTASAGGIPGNGTVFAVNTSGTSFTPLHSFRASSGSFPNYTNSDGADPYAGLVLSSNMLYGAASAGGTLGGGTLFAVNISDLSFTNLYNFTAIHTNSAGVYTNSEGANPKGGMILSGNTLYGTASSGGISGNGTVFGINTNGTGFKILHTFTAGHKNAAGIYTNADGAYLQAGLILSGNTLYGTTSSGGISGNGTVFAINTDSTGFTNLYNFTATSGLYATNRDGAHPMGVILAGNMLYGTARYGGSSGAGSLFTISLPPPNLTIIQSSTNVVLTWPTYVPGVTLLFTTNLVSSAVWSTNSPAPTIVNGQNAVTNPISGTQMFFRLSQ
jgi:uncharacterized repeat protein (TIGR03803 family)